MSGSNSSPEKENNLPTVVPQPTLPVPSAGKSAVTGILTALAPLALEVAYGLTRKWLSGTTARTGKTGNSLFQSSGSRVGTGLRQRRRGK